MTDPARRFARTDRVARLGLLVALVALVASGCGSPADPTPRPVRRVLLVTLPGVTWHDVRSSHLPNLRRFIHHAAIGDASTRVGRVKATTTAAYLTLGAGTRSVVPPVDNGVALNPEELHGGVPGSDLLERRLGHPLDGIAYIPVGATIDANQASPFGGSPGMLGDALAEAGVRRAVIANADAAEGFPSDQPPPDGAYSRSAATALMGSDGVVPEGDVGRGLLRDDPAAPFGRRLDPDAVLRTFQDSWDRGGRSVVLVEASDLSRAAAYGSRSTPRQARHLRAQALADADHLLGELLREVDPDTDAVMVLAPVARSSLGVTALRTSQVRSGLLRSASTRRAGYVTLADVAPTILELLGEAQPADIEGRTIDAVPSSGNRVDLLDGRSAAAGVRDGRLVWVVPGIIAGLAVLAAATLWRDRLPDRLRRLLRPAAVGALGVVPGTFVAGVVPAAQTGDGAFVAVVAACVAILGVAGWACERRWPGIGPIVGVGAILGLLAGDLLLGGPLQVNTTFGYSMAVAGRFTGFGNLAFALFASAAICLAVVLYDRYGRRALPWILGVLVVAVLFDGLPMLGADVGGVISVVPAFGVTLLALRGRRIAWRELLGCLVVTGIFVVGFGLLDASRPAASQTHLARVGGDMTAGRLGAVGTILWRRLHASFGANQTILWLVSIALVLVALCQAFLVSRGVVGPGRTGPPRRPTTIALVAGLSLVAVLGLVANDSSVAVPATMLIVISPVVMLRETIPETSSGFRLRGSPR